jgi:hypothetical protein
MLQQKKINNGGGTLALLSEMPRPREANLRLFFIYIQFEQGEQKIITYLEQYLPQARQATLLNSMIT